jgi:predicted small metal-binding protein
VQVIDCKCGVTLQAPNEDELARRVKRHLEEDHEDAETSEDQVRELVALRSYEATDS